MSSSEMLGRSTHDAENWSSSDDEVNLMNSLDQSRSSLPKWLYVGMLFSSADDAYECYNKFAEKVGFGTKKFTTRFSNGVVVRRYYVCALEGFKKKSDNAKGKKHRIDERCGCMARLIIDKNENGDWVITYFSNDHNHILLSSPSKIKALRSHNKTHLKSETKALVNDLYECNIGPAQSARILNSLGGIPEMHVTAKQCCSILRERRKNNVGNQCVAVIEQFIERQCIETNFYYAVEVDEDGTCRSLFWADGRARESYMNFSDVVVFDVTYRTNNYLLPFAPFTGVNHHFQSTLFGCALLADEREETFVWLFQNWLRCMWNKAPGAIITDQDPAICNAITRVFPATCHRYCTWHISLHEDEHLRPLRVAYGTEFNNDYNNWKRNNQTIEESESYWRVLNDKYNVFVVEKQNSESKAWKWLDYMYAKRCHWVEAFLRDKFFAGMKSSQRSESMNAFFNGFVRSKTPLCEFVQQYENALYAQREREEMEDKMCLTSNPNFKGIHELEAHATKFYTRKMLSIFQKEFKDVFYCNHSLLLSEGSCSTYKVISRIDGFLNSTVVTCNIDLGSFICSCAKFETMGLLCKHILYVMKQVYDFTEIPENFLLPRWSLKYRFTSTMNFSNVDKSDEGGKMGKKVSPLESWVLRANFNRVLQLADKNHDIHSYLSTEIGRVREHCELLQSQCNNVSQPTHIQNSQRLMPIGITIFDPKNTTRKGRPVQASRFKSGIEKVKNEMEKRSRTCKGCGKKGHDVRTCELKNS